MYINITDQSIRRSAIISYLLAIILGLLWVLYAGFTGKNLVIYMVSIVILPGLSIWGICKTFTGKQRNMVVKTVTVNSQDARAIISDIARKQHWRLREREGKLEMETPLSLVSFGERITVELRQGEAVVTSASKLAGQIEDDGRNRRNVQKIEQALVG